MCRIACVILCLSLTMARPALGQTSKNQSVFPITIQRVDARCVEVLKTIVGGTKSMPPQYFYAPSGFLFRIAVEIHLGENTPLPDPAFRVVAALPCGERYTSVVKREDVVPLGSSRFSFTIDVPVKKNGWADIIIVPTDAEPRPDLYDYDIRSNKRSIHLECHLQSDVKR